MTETDIIKELRKQRVPVNKDQTKLVEKLYNECLGVIKFKNKNGIRFLSYEVPRITLGFPLYEASQIAIDLNTYFKKLGFKTTLSRTKIFISW